MKFKRSYSDARNLGSAYKFAFGKDINRALSITWRIILAPIKAHGETPQNFQCTVNGHIKALLAIVSFTLLPNLNILVAYILYSSKYVWRKIWHK